MNVAQTPAAASAVAASAGKKVFDKKVKAPAAEPTETKVEAAATSEPTAAPTAEPTVTTVKAPREKREGTKQEKAIAIFKRENGDRAKVVAAIIAEVGMSQAGATTYFYNAKKAVKKAEAK